MTARAEDGSAGVRGVLFDFHDTLVHAGSLAAWVADGAGEDVPADERKRAIAVLPDVWAHAAQRWPGSSWDLSPAEHRRAFTRVLQEEGGCSPALATALDDSMPNQWQLARGVAPLLAALSRNGIRTGIVSNIAIDIRPVLDQWGLMGQLDAVVLSFEVGLVKPDPAIFLLAAEAIDRNPAECLMVGDSPAVDGAASRVGMPSLIVPKGDAGPRLDAVAPLCGVTPGRRPPGRPGDPSGQLDRSWRAEAHHGSSTPSGPSSSPAPQPSHRRAAPLPEIRRTAPP